MKEFTTLYTLDLIHHNEQLRNLSIGMCALLASNLIIICTDLIGQTAPMMIGAADAIISAAFAHSAWKHHKISKRLREAYNAGE